MEKGYAENGFIVDVSHASRMSQIIYELSAVLEMPEAKDKEVLLKLGSFDMNVTQLLSVRAMVESMGLTLGKISTTSKITIDSADEIGLELAELENVVPTIDFEAKPEVNKELKVALDKIFGGDSSNISDIHETVKDAVSEVSNTESVEVSDDEYSDAAAHDEFNKVIENANSIQAQVDIDEIAPELTGSSVEYTNLTEEEKELLKETEQLPTLYIQRTLRSGQSVKSEGNIVLIGDVNPGSEIIAKGDITVWGILGGIAHAGCDGNFWAKVRALKMNPIQLRIADVLARRPDSANIPYIQKTDTFVPEEAVMRNKQIFIRKLYEN